MLLLGLERHLEVAASWLMDHVHYQGGDGTVWLVACETRLLKFDIIVRLGDRG